MLVSVLQARSDVYLRWRLHHPGVRTSLLTLPHDFDEPLPDNFLNEIRTYGVMLAF